jgi:hypothetical protein
LANTRIALRRTSVAGRAANSTYINSGELGLNMADQILYSIDTSNNVFIIGANVVTESITNNMFIGNSSVGVLANSTVISIGNSSLSGVLLLFKSNSTVNSIINATALVFNVNSSVYASLTGNSLISVGNSFFTISTTNAASTPLTVQGAASATANLFQVANSGSTVLAVNSSGVAVGNGAGLTSLVATGYVSLSAIDQAVTGGCIVTSYNLGITNSTVNSITIDSGKCPLQYITNNGAFTCTAPSNDGFCIVQILNGTSANTITFSGWQVNSISGTGDTYNTSNGSIFNVQVLRINGNSNYIFKQIK